MQPTKETLINFKYLHPPLNAFSISHSPEYIKHGKQKKNVRKIFHFVHYDEYENEKIKELTAAIEEEKIVLPQNWLESDTLKYCYAGKFKIPNCIKQLKKHLEWMQNDKIQILSDGAQDLLQRGVIYAYGRDKLCRPIVVFDVHKINFKRDKIESILGAFSFMLTTVYNNMFLPGIIENWIIVIDINNMSLLNVPFKMLQKVIDCMSSNYVSTVERLLITNPSSSLFLMWKIIEAMMDPETVQKIRFIKKANFHEMQEFIGEDQLQKKYGGKLENLTEFWPPKVLVDVRKDIDTIEKKIKALRERLVTGCQITNCLPEKKEELPKQIKNILEINPKNILDSIPIEEPKILKNESNHPLIDSSPKEKKIQIEENQTIAQGNVYNNNLNNKSSQSLPETNSSYSLKNEAFAEFNEVVVVKNGHQPNHNKMNEYEIISEKNEFEEKEIEGLELDDETSLKKRSKQPNLIIEREEKTIKCQPCKECALF